MTMPLNILDEIGRTYRPTRKLHQTLANLVAATIENLERSRNGTNVQSVSFGSPTDTLNLPPIHLAGGIDASLRFNLSNNGSPGRSSVANPAANAHSSTPVSSGTAPITPLRWQDAANGQTPQSAENKQSPPVVGLDKPSTTLEPNRLVSNEGFDNSILWGPTLEWTGGWDDFLNAIAM